METELFVSIAVLALPLSWLTPSQPEGQFAAQCITLRTAQHLVSRGIMTITPCTVVSLLRVFISATRLDWLVALPSLGRGNIRSYRTGKLFVEGQKIKVYFMRSKIQTQVSTCLAHLTVTDKTDTNFIVYIYKKKKIYIVDRVYQSNRQTHRQTLWHLDSTGQVPLLIQFTWHRLPRCQHSFQLSVVVQ